MVKRCVVEFDELGKPIGLIDLKDFSDIKSFKDFQELCKKNKEEFLNRQEAAAKKAYIKESMLYERIEKLEKKAEILFEGIRYLLGIEDNKNIYDYFSSLDEEEESDEEEN